METTNPKYSKYIRKATCKVCGSSNVFCKGLCNKHYQQLRKHGKIIDSTPRSYRDPNDIRLFQDHGEIYLYNAQGKKVATFKFDLEDIYKLLGHKWYYNKTKHQEQLLNKELGPFSRLVLDNPDGIVKTIGDPFDLRKQNLEILPKIRKEKILEDLNGIFYHRRENGYYTCVHISHKFYLISKVVKSIPEACYLKQHFLKLIKKEDKPSSVVIMQELTNTLTKDQIKKLNKYIHDKNNDWKERIKKCTKENKKPGKKKVNYT